MSSLVNKEKLEKKIFMKLSYDTIPPCVANYFKQQPGYVDPTLWSMQW